MKNVTEKSTEDVASIPTGALSTSMVGTASTLAIDAEGALLAEQSPLAGSAFSVGVVLIVALLACVTIMRRPIDADNRPD